MLEIGAGAGAVRPLGRAPPGGAVVATDLSVGMAAHGRDRQPDRSTPGRPCRSPSATGSRCRFADASFDRVFTAYGAVPFVADTAPC